MPKIYDEILDTTFQDDTNPRYTMKNNSGDVLYDDIQMELKTPVLQEGTSLNKDFLNRLFTYEEMECETIDHTYQQDVTRTITLGPASPTTGSKNMYWYSNEVLHDSSAAVTCKITTTATNGWQLKSSTTAGYDSFYGAEDGNFTTSISTIAKLLKQTSTASSLIDTKDYIAFKGHSSSYTSTITMTFDFQKPRKLSLVIYGYSSTGGTTTFAGSNNDSSYTTISTIQFRNIDSYPSETAYRYYKLTLPKDYNITIYRLFFYDVEDVETVPDFETRFTANTDIIPNKAIYVKTPANMPVENVTKASINGIPVSPFEYTNAFHKLLYNSSSNAFERKSRLTKYTIDVPAGATITGKLNNAQVLIASIANSTNSALLFIGDVVNLYTGSGSTLSTRITLDSALQYTLMSNIEATVNILAFEGSGYEW